MPARILTSGSLAPDISTIFQGLVSQERTTAFEGSTGIYRLLLLKSQVCMGAIQRILYLKGQCGRTGLQLRARGERWSKVVPLLSSILLMLLL